MGARIRRHAGGQLLAPAGILLLVVFARGFSGSAIGVGAEQKPPDPPVSAELRAALMAEGQEVYGRDCAECHAEGGIGAALADDKRLEDKDRVILRILLGSTDGAMAPFGPSLTDREIAAVGTFIRNTWDNAFGAIVEADVKRVRATIKKNLLIQSRNISS